MEHGHVSLACSYAQVRGSLLANIQANMQVRCPFCPNSTVKALVRWFSYSTQKQEYYENLSNAVAAAAADVSATNSTAHPLTAATAAPTNGK